MTSVVVGQNIDAAPALDLASKRDEFTEIVEALEHPTELNAIRALIHDEMAAAVADAERRLAQARQLERSAIFGEPRQVHTEDLNLSKHMIDGYTLTANSPTAGKIAWANLHIVYLGVDYTISDGNTPNTYVYFIKPGSGTTATLSTSNSMPTLGANDCLVFVNQSGTPYSVLEASVSYAVGDNVIDTQQIKDGAVTGTKTSFYTALNAAVVAAQAAADAAQATANGAINTYYQSTAPWPSGVARPTGNEVGDVWYDSDDGQAYRWSGSGGSPANTWVAINDSDMGAALAAAATAQSTADSKNTVFNAVNASPPTAIKVNDLWIVSDVDNLFRRWNGGSWVNVQFGDTAISTLSGTKIGTGISGTNITVGTIAAARIGAGVTAADLSSGTGTIGSSQIATGAVGTTQLANAAVTPPKINTGLHLLY